MSETVPDLQQKEQGRWKTVGEGPVAKGLSMDQALWVMQGHPSA
jgi:hypothetical protein